LDQYRTAGDLGSHDRHDHAAGNCHRIISHLITLPYSMNPGYLNPAGSHSNERLLQVTRYVTWAASGVATLSSSSSSGPAPSNRTVSPRSAAVPRRARATRAATRCRAQRRCLPRTRTPEVANMPPFPSTTLISGPSTWAAASPRTWRTDSWMANMPYMPVCVYDSPPPLVLSGSEPPGSVLPSGMNATRSPLGPKP